MSLQISGETSEETIDREFAEQALPLEQKRLVLLAQRSAALAIVNKPDQLQSERESLERRYNTAVAGRSFQERENLREPIYNLRQFEDAAREAASLAAVEIRRLGVELAGIQTALEEIEAQTFLRHRVRLIKNLIEPAVEFVKRQEELDSHDAAGRAHGYRLIPVGIVMDRHPTATRTSRNSDDVKTYLEFLLAERDPRFAESLSDDHPARRKLRAASNGAGVAGLALRWG